MTRVMIVENLEKPLWSAKKLLSSINFEIVFETGNGYEAIEKYDLIKPDFVLLDYTLSKNDGLSVLKAIKKLNPEAKIIIVTYLGNQKQLEEFIKNGSFAILTAPYKMKDFLTLVNNKELTFETKSREVAPVIADDKT